MVDYLALFKIALPYLPDIIQTVKPKFSRSDNGKPEEIVPRQIEELQGAVTRNAETIGELAVQLQDAIDGIEAGAAKIQQEFVFLRRLAAGSMMLALAGVALAVWAIAGK